jgi:hypothetical protein
LTLNELIAAINVEEKSKASFGGMKAANIQANVAEHRNQPAKNMKKEKKVSGPTRPKNNIFKKKKDQIICYVCGEKDHKANRCQNRKGRGPSPDRQHGAKAQVHVVVAQTDNSGSGTAANGYVPKAFMADSSSEWWIDTGATRHICADRSCFFSLQTATGGSVLMGNGVVATVRGVEQVSLKLTSGKILVLKDVLYVPTMTRNLLSGSMLCRQGIKLVFESNKAVFTKSGSFVGKGYECGGMFRLSVVDTTANIFCSSYSNNNIDLWHSHLCHVNRDAIVRMSKMDLILTYNFDRNHECEVCVQAKQPRKPFFIRLREGTPHSLS